MCFALDIHIYFENVSAVQHYAIGILYISKICLQMWNISISTGCR